MKHGLRMTRWRRCCQKIASSLPFSFLVLLSRCHFLSSCPLRSPGSKPWSTEDNVCDIKNRAFLYFPCGWGCFRPSLLLLLLLLWHHFTRKCDLPIFTLITERTVYNTASAQRVQCLMFVESRGSRLSIVGCRLHSKTKKKTHPLFNPVSSVHSVCLHTLCTFPHALSRHNARLMMNRRYHPTRILVLPSL